MPSRPRARTVSAARATLVRFTLPDAPDARSAALRKAVLFLHGWSDYFFNIELARFWDAQGFEFFALDMHNHGRSLQPDTPGGYVADLEHYDAEIGTAVGMIAESAGADAPAARPHGPFDGRPRGGAVGQPQSRRFSHLVLNSPWLEMHRSALVRRAARTMRGADRPAAARGRDPAAGARLLLARASAALRPRASGTLDDAYRPPLAFPVRAGWLSAILAGQAAGRAAWTSGRPVLVLMSGGERRTASCGTRKCGRRRGAGREHRRPPVPCRWARSVTVERIDGALHDVFLSRRSVRADAYAGGWPAGSSGLLLA